MNAVLVAGASMEEHERFERAMQMNNFLAYTVGLEVVEQLVPIVAKLKEHSADLSDQLERAATSMVLNIGEGSRRVGKDRVQFFRRAAGSAQEVKSVLDLAVRWGWHVDTSKVTPLLHREGGLLWGLTHPKKA